MLNGALRLPNIEIVVKMSFFSRNLHEQIRSFHPKVTSRQRSTIYCVQCLTNESFGKLGNSTDAFLSFHSRNISLEFVRRAVSHRVNIVEILLYTETDSAVPSTTFASLDDASWYADAEHEILFSMYTVVRFGEMIKPDLHWWRWWVAVLLNNVQPTDLRRLVTLTIQEPSLIATKPHDLFVTLKLSERSGQIVFAYLLGNHADLPPLTAISTKSVASRVISMKRHSTTSKRWLLNWPLCSWTTWT
jgi:hypothetical protein